MSLNRKQTIIESHPLYNDGEYLQEQAIIDIAQGETIQIVNKTTKKILYEYTALQINCHANVIILDKGKQKPDPLIEAK